MQYITERDRQTGETTLREGVKKCPHGGGEGSVPFADRKRYKCSCEVAGRGKNTTKQHRFEI